MPIISLHYRGSVGNDIHLIRGEASRDLTTTRQAFDLRETGLLFDTDQGLAWADVYLPAHPGVRIAFKPVFDAVAIRDDDGEITAWQGFGISVDRNTGVVSFPGPLDARAPGNIIIECSVTDNEDGIDPDRIEPAPIRVHVHPGVRRIWMTPDSLLVHRRTAVTEEETQSRFTVRAEFTDDTVGDITEHHGVEFSPPGNVITRGEKAGRLIINPFELAGAEVEIEALWKGFSDKKKFKVGAPWASDPQRPEAEFVEGPPGTRDGSSRPENFPNVLIFGDGFTEDDVPAFNEFTNGLIDRLRKDPLTRPFDKLATSMNFWRTMVPAPARGVSVRCEVYTFHAAGRDWAALVPTALRPTASAGWTLSNLIYMAGLPMPSDSGKSADELRLQWGDWMPVGHLDDIVNIDGIIIRDWRSLSTRTLIDEIDGFPGMALGTPPNAGETSDSPLIRIHPLRGGRAALSPFFEALRAGNGATVPAPAAGSPLGNLWARNHQVSQFDNPSYVVMLAGFEIGRAVQIDGDAERPSHIAMPIKADAPRTTVAPAPDGRRAVLLDLTEPMTTTAVRTGWRTLAHELGHAFDLGDEYVEEDGVYRGPEESINQYANLTTSEFVQVVGQILPERIKWNWHRARRAALLSGPPAGSGGFFELPLQNKGGLKFKEDDVVFLRQRVRRTVIIRSPVTSLKLTVTDVDANGDKVTVRGAIIDPDAFDFGSVLYLAVPHPGAPDEFLRLVSPKVAKFIEEKNRPLTRWPCRPSDQLGTDADGNPLGGHTQVPLFDGFPADWPHHNAARVIGLYSGGAHKGCGVFRPAGQCMMRGSDLEGTQFCHVCRFVIVETINPAMHGAIDADYDRYYPL